jgi:hypothetical protein
MLPLMTAPGTLPVTDIHALLAPDAERIDMDAVAACLDVLHHEARVEVVRSISPKEQARLFDAAHGYRPLTVEDFVPSDVGTMREVIHWGRNSLPAFADFQKRFMRPDDPTAKDAGELWGYNEQTMKTVTGPGYFVCYDIADGEVLIDYTRSVPFGLDDWPKVLPNSAKLSRFIYNGTTDTMRGVSRHVTIGRAARAGEWMPNWFVLCRQDVPAL